MKKGFSLALALAMMATMLVGCGSKPAAFTPADDLSALPVSVKRCA